MTEWNDEPQEQAPYEEPAGTGKVLLYFFAVVVLCAISVGVGYWMGRRTTPPAPDAVAGSSPAPVASGVAKPGAVREAAAPVSEEITPSPSPSPEPVAAKPAGTAPKSASAKGAAKAPEKAPEMPRTGQGIMVQVAAVTRQEDAETLAGALRKKQYPVFVLPASGADKFFHVQVGPFAELKDAEAMKTKLAADGYNAIVKK